eukprot:138839-Pelagomonas_calceolata.AAC.1
MHNTIGKCVGMLTTERLSTLTEVYEAAKQAGLHNTLQPPVQDIATEIMGLLQQIKAKNKHILAKSKKVYNFNADHTFPHAFSPTEVLHDFHGK